MIFIILGYIKVFAISLGTGFGLGFGFWTAHLLCKKMRRLK